MFATKTLGEADIISVSGIISKTTSFAEGKHHSKKSLLSIDKRDFFVGAGGGTRTHTVSLPTDFESVTSANSIIPAFITDSLYYIQMEKSILNLFFL